ncbi:MAG: hypothetical protein JXQ65_10015 [Candidatus Marinimicrobia bacterium]|nr:hypothetical protein [Candidatus Neomarinimicrobiota bacterium]
MGFINNLKASIIHMSKDFKPFDPASLQDEIALKTQWTPVRRGGTSFKTHNIHKSSTFRLEIRPSLMSLLFPLIFCLAGLAPIVIIFLQKQTTPLLDNVLIPVLFGSIFLIVGIVLFLFTNTPHFFDKSLGFYWKGKKSDDQVQQAKVKCRLADIYALQIISEYIRNTSSSGSGSSYHSYEINLVLKTGERINVLDHGARNKIMEQAKELSEFLNVPVWNPVNFL